MLIVVFPGLNLKVISTGFDRSAWATTASLNRAIRVPRRRCSALLVSNDWFETNRGLLFPQWSFAVALPERYDAESAA